MTIDKLDWINGVAESFLNFLLHKARRLRDDAGHSGAHDDGGAGALEREIAAYRAGMAKDVPSFWNTDLEQFLREKDPDYVKYLELRRRFEGR